jgi:multiple antibiotic resistance protein
MELFLATFSALFSVVNPFGAMPVFLTLTHDDTPDRRNQQARNACFYMLGILVVFFFIGQYVLNFFGVRIHDLRIAGGLMIMKAGFDLLNSKTGGGRKISKTSVADSLQRNDISFAPLAMPMLSGPGAIAVSISMFKPNLHTLDFILIIAGIALVALLSYAILYFSSSLMRFMGRAGLEALSKIMGFIVLAIGVNFIVSSIIELLKM